MTANAKNGHTRVETSATLIEIEGDCSNDQNASGSPPITQKEGTSEPILTTHRNRTLVLCFDGTNNQFNEDNSNVVEFVGLLKRDDPSMQLVYYQSGIGTFTSPRYSFPIVSDISKLIDLVFAWNLQAHIEGGYKFLMQNYRPSDKICIFGFSRGAYTAQCLGGMLTKVGLLPPNNKEQISFAYNLYKDASKKGWRESHEFKRKFGFDVEVEFMGLWDSVNSVGPTPIRLPYTVLNPEIKTFRHAVALDEHRVKFRPLHRHPPTVTNNPDGEGEGKAGGKTSDEVWFSGCHADVGGSAVKNSVKTSLARIPLRWMIRECFKTNSGILFLPERLKTVNLDPNTLDHTSCRPKALEAPDLTKLDPSQQHYINRPQSKDYVSTSGLIIGFLNLRRFKRSDQHLHDTNNYDENCAVDSEELADLKDALAPIYDDLDLKMRPIFALFWWFLEYIPFKYRYHDVDNRLQDFPEVAKRNKGHGRKIPTYKGREEALVRVHRSVKTRIHASYQNGEKYTPKAKNFDENKVDWVD